MLLELFIGAFLGGLLLNLSPCILPVISLKILSFTNMAEGSARARVVHSLCYSGGIIVSFLILGAITAIIKLTGGLVVFGSWALSSSIFNGVMGLIIGLLGTHFLLRNIKVAQTLRSWLIGHIKRFRKENKGKGSRFYNVINYMSEKAYSVRQKTPYLGSFLYGVLTTALGSACCGPVLASAMGMALVLSPGIILTAFVLSGIGMACPYALLGAFPSLSKRLIPKSGVWIKWTEIGAGIALLLTSIWFLSLCL